MIKILFIIFVILNILDIYTTLKILEHGGREKNPVVRKFIEWLKPFPALILVKAVMILAVFFAIKYIGNYSYYLLGFGNGIYIWVIINNFRVLKKIKETFTYHFTHWGV